MAEEAYSFGYWLRRRRRALDLTQAELASRVACSAFAIRKIEADERRPSKALAERLASRLGLTESERADFLAAARGVRVDRLSIESRPRTDIEADAPSTAGAPTTAGPRPSPAPGNGDFPPLPEAPRTPAMRTPFVGRDAELAAVDQAIGQARAGQGQVVLLAGEAGIGKTRTAQQAAMHAADHGMTVLWARSPEEPGAPPYWPWIQLIRGFCERQDRAMVAEALGTGARWISGIVPDIAGMQPATAPKTIVANAAGTDAALTDAALADAAEARFRLFDAVASFWRRASRTAGVLIVWDDLHWADASSLRMLEFVAAEAREARLAILATYRDNEIDRRHPLSDSLSRLGRLENCHRVPLAGLTLEQTLALASRFGHEAQADAERFHQQTEGNPLYVSEMARFLAGPEARGGAMRRVPEGIRAAIGSRLNRLSPACNRLLVHAAVIGRSFEWSVLRSMIDASSGASSDEGSADSRWSRAASTDAARTDAARTDAARTDAGSLLEAPLLEALQAAIIEETPDSDVYRFSHALVRETLYDEIPSIRRPALHYRAACALASLGDHLPGQLSRLAHHFSASLPTFGAEEALAYNRRAGVHAMAMLAYEDAGERFQAALEALSIIERRTAPDLLARCDLLIRRGQAQNAAADYPAARDTLRAAADLAMAADSSAHLARAAIGFEDASWRPGLPGDESIALLRAALARIGDRNAAASASILSSLTRALIFTGAADEAVATAQQAVEVARRCGDPAVLVRALACGLSARWLPERIEARLQAATEAVAIAKQANDLAGVLDAWPWRLFDLMELGIDDAFHEELRAFIHLADESRRPFHIYTAASFGPALALMRGDLEESERQAAHLLALGERQPGLDASGVHATQLFTLARERGQLRELAPLVAHFVATTPAAQRWRPGLALVFAELGMTEQASRELDVLSRDDFARLPRDGLWVAALAYLAEVSVLLDDQKRSAQLYRLLLPFADRNLVVGTAVACFGAASRFLGMLALAQRQPEEALRHLRHAIDFNRRQGARTWLAHSYFQCALALRERKGAGDLDEAKGLLGNAMALAEEAQLTALADRVRLLQAGG